MRFLIHFILFLASCALAVGQNPILPANQQIDWSTAGIPGGIPNYPISVNVLDYGAVADGVTDNKAAFEAAFSAAPQNTAVFVPAGNYLIKGTLNLYHSHKALRGDCPLGSSRLLFSFTGTNETNAIRIVGGSPNDLDNVLNASLPKGTTAFQLNDATGYQVGSFAEIWQDNDPVLMYTNPTWNQPHGYTAVGQLFKVISINGNMVTVDRPLNINYNTALNPVMRPLNNVRQYIGVENLYIEQVDPGDYTINISDAVHCWVKNVESKTCNKAHFAFARALGCEISGSYAHESHDYGPGGHGYGIVVGRHSTSNLFQNNVFRKLRHAMIVSKGVTGCVFAYNFSIDQTWQYGSQAADLSLHGHYPNMNLFEANIVEYAHNSDYWGPSGPGNTLFRNRIFVTNIRVSDHSHFQNVVANEILYGSIIIDASVNNTWLKANNVQGTIQNPVSSAISPSLYLNSVPDFLTGYPFPPIGPEYVLNTHSIPAKDRFDAGTPIQDPNCPCIQNLPSTNLNGTYVAREYIESNGQVQNGSNAVFDAGSEVKLKPGFKVHAGGDFHGLIDGCD